jgi:hypothetical protein
VIVIVLQDLGDLGEFTRKNSGVRYLLIAIDVFSRYVFVEGMKTKSMDSTVTAFEAIFAREQRSPQYLNTDMGNYCDYISCVYILLR